MTISFKNDAQTLEVKDETGFRTLYVERLENDNLLFTIEAAETGDVKGQMALSLAQVTALATLVQYLEEINL